MLIPHPNEAEKEANEALTLLFHQDGVTPAIICDNAKEMIPGEFHRKLNKGSCQLRQTTIHTMVEYS